MGRDKERRHGRGGDRTGWDREMRWGDKENIVRRGGEGKERFGENEGGSREGGRWRKERLKMVRMQWQGQGKDRAAILEKTQGRGLGERWEEKGQGIEVEGREDIGERQAKQWGDRESVGEQGRGEEVGNVTGASGWGAGEVAVLAPCR